MAKFEFSMGVGERKTGDRKSFLNPPPRRSKKWPWLVGALLLIPLAISGCSRATPDPGHVKVLVEKPLFFGHGGIDPHPVTTGSEFIAVTTDQVDVEVVPFQEELKLNDLMSSDGVPLSFDAVIRLRVTDPVSIIGSFGPNWYNANLEREFANRMRTAVKKYSMNDTAISTTAIDAIDAEVSQGLSAYIKSIHMPVELIEVTAGKALTPDAISTQRVETAQQEQRIKTEAQTKLAEDARKAAEQSRAEADNAYRNALNMSPEQFIELEKIKMQREVCARGGACTFVMGPGAALVNSR